MVEAVRALWKSDHVANVRRVAKNRDESVKACVVGRDVPRKGGQSGISGERESEEPGEEDEKRGRKDEPRARPP